MYIHCMSVYLEKSKGQYIQNMIIDSCGYHER